MNKVTIYRKTIDPSRESETIAITLSETASGTVYAQVWMPGMTDAFVVFKKAPVELVLSQNSRRGPVFVELRRKSE